MKIVVCKQCEREKYDIEFRGDDEICIACKKANWLAVPADKIPYTRAKKLKARIKWLKGGSSGRSWSRQRRGA